MSEGVSRGRGGAGPPCPEAGRPANLLASPDQIGLPDFNAGAMENWGLVTYRENSLLFDPESSSSSNKERVVTVIAHELAHQVAGAACGVQGKEVGGGALQQAGAQVPPRQPGREEG